MIFPISLLFHKDIHKGNSALTTRDHLHSRGEEEEEEEAGLDGHGEYVTINARC